MKVLTLIWLSMLSLILLQGCGTTHNLPDSLFHVDEVKYPADPITNKKVATLINDLDGSLKQCRVNLSTIKGLR